MEKKSIKANTILNAMRMMLTVMVPLITFPYTSRIFLADGTGKLNFSSSIAQIFTLFASLGIYSYGVREGSKVRRNREAFSKLAHELLIINGVSTVITYCLFISCVIFLPSFKEYTLLLLIYGLSIGFTALGLDWIYGVYEEYLYITFRQIAVQIFTIITMFFMVHSIDDLYLWAFVSAISSVGANIFNFIHARKYLDFRRVKTVKYELTKHLTPIFVLFATQLAAKVYSNVDIVLLGILSTDYHVGLYSAAVKINTVLITCFTAMSPVFMPRIVEYIKNNNKNEFYLFLNKIIRLIILLAMPAVVGIEMLSEEIIILLAGKSFVNAAGSMRILAPIILVTACANVLYYDILVPYNKEKYVLLCTTLGTIINLVISWFLIPHWAEKGAAIGSLISETTALCLAILICYRQDHRLKLVIPGCINYIAGSAFIIVCCWGIKRVFSNSIIVLFVAVVFSLIGYGVILLVTNDSIGKEGVAGVRKIYHKIKRS